ncbi:secondary thiamine-phosphate synthase enzyme YjbQ [Parahalioglobus pacificus]|nr:secondary thiamine-phosphate synthase enzyme YjbQ [Halioglobus pacificus]
MITEVAINANGQGLHSITTRIQSALSSATHGEGLCTLFLQHTSASLLIQENYDDSARIDLERWLNRLVPENDALYTHTLEGADDMPAHIKTALTATQLSIPFRDGQLMLGTWQGIYLWEHRHGAQQRRVLLHIAKD